MGNGPDGPLLIESAADRNERERTEEQRRDRRYRKLQLWFNGILMVATILTAGIVLYQNRILKLTLAETKNLAIAAKVQADAAVTQSAAAKASAEATTTAANATKRQADAGAITNELTKRVLDSSIDASRLDQRAWVTVKAVNVSNVLQVGQHPTATVFIENTSKSPAVNLKISHNIAYSKGPLPLGRMTFQEPPEKGIGVLAPSTQNTPSVASSLAMTEETIAAFKSRGLRFYVYGRIEYNDIFRRPHQTEYCFEAVSGSTTGQANACTQWNTAD